MTTLTRKQREIQQREELILDVSRRMLVEEGYGALTMDRIAEMTEYSKGVVYQHFKSKEDLVAAMAIQSMRRRVEWFSRAVQFEGRAREKIQAIGVAEELFVRLHPHHFHSEQIIKMGSLRDRASIERTQGLGIKENECFLHALSVVNLAIQTGDLRLPPSSSPAAMVLALWALNVGCYSLMHVNEELLKQHGIEHPFSSVRRNCHALMDGFGWRPLSSEWNYDATYSKILEQVFPEESVQAGLSNHQTTTGQIQ